MGGGTVKAWSRVARTIKARRAMVDMQKTYRMVDSPTHLSLTLAGSLNVSRN